MKYKILDKEGQKRQLEKRLKELERDHYGLIVYQDVLEQQIPNEEGNEQQRLAGELARTATQIRQCETEIKVLLSHLKDVQ